MLKKLIKYDLKSTLKVVVIFYSLSLFFAILTRIFFSIENSFIMDILGKICSGVTISMIINIIINNLMRLWVDFKRNLYGDESYLTHTLPVKKTTLYLSKILTSAITLLISTLVIGLTLFIAYYSKENIELIKSLLSIVATTYGSTVMKILIAVLVIVFLEIANLLQTGYTGIILGHKMNNAKTGYSILFGFLSYMGSQIFVLICIFITGLFNKNIMNLFYTTETIGVDVIKTIISLATISYILVLVITYIVNLKLFKKGVNID